MEKSKLYNIRTLVQATVKDLTYIGIDVSADGAFININISFGNQAKIISIKIEDIIKNQHSTKDFVALISEPLEAILK